MSQRLERLLLAIVALSMALTAAGCSPAPAATPGTGPTLQGVTLTDAAGQVVKLQQLPQRLVLVGRGPYMGLHLLYQFPSAWDLLVGLEKKGPTADDFLPFVDPNWEQKIILNAAPNAEQIAALQPDLVLMKGIVPDALGKALAQVNIPTLYLALETPEQFFRDVHNLGLVLGAEARGRDITAYYKTRLDLIEQRLAGLAEKDRPRVLLVEYTDRGGVLALNVPARSWMQTTQVQIAGGGPVWLDAVTATEGWTITNLEQVALWDPEQIFVVMSYALNARVVIDKLKADPLWSQLKAVRNGELYAFPADLYEWDKPGPRWILGVTWLAARIHPDRFADLDMKAEVYAFFDYLYNMARSAVDANIMPWVEMDVH